MTALVTGASGQLGRALLLSAPPEIHPIGYTHAQLDISARESVSDVLRTQAPLVVVNAAAYTNVDRAEDDPAAAWRVNAEAPGILAECCAHARARLIQVSTDFVFSGAANVPYEVASVPEPLSVYGKSKLAGEQRARAVLVDECCIFRTSWLYDGSGTNFLTRMLYAMRTGSVLKVVVDQVGAPTWCPSLATAIWSAVTCKLAGIHHWSDSGVASRYDFAVAIGEEALAAGLLPALPDIQPIRSAQFPTRASRPAYSVLDKAATELALGLRAVHWRENLRLALRALAAGAAQ